MLNVSPHSRVTGRLTASCPKKNNNPAVVAMVTESVLCHSQLRSQSAIDYVSSIHSPIYFVSIPVINNNNISAASVGILWMRIVTHTLKLNFSKLCESAFNKQNPILIYEKCMFQVQVSEECFFNPFMQSGQYSGQLVQSPLI